LKRLILRAKLIRYVTTIESQLTMEKSLLDTDIFSEILKAKNPTVVENAVAYREHFPQYTLSAVTVTEMVKGFQRVGRLDAIERLTTALAREEVLSLDHESAILAGQIYGELEREGMTIGRADPFIAGIALRNNLTLVTGNTRHFQRIVLLGFPLSLQNWRG